MPVYLRTARIPLLFDVPTLLEGKDGEDEGPACAAGFVMSVMT